MAVKVQKTLMALLLSQSIATFATGMMIQNIPKSSITSLKTSPCQSRLALDMIKSIIIKIDVFYHLENIMIIIYHLDF